MDRAFLRHTQKFVPLRGAQVTYQRHRRTQAIDAGAFLAGIALHGNLDTVHCYLLLFRVPHHSPRLDRAQRAIEDVVEYRHHSPSAHLVTAVRVKSLSYEMAIR